MVQSTLHTSSAYFLRSQSNLTPKFKALPNTQAFDHNISRSKHPTAMKRKLEAIPSESKLHRIGYQVFKNAIRIDDQVVEHMRHHVTSRSRGSQIFNHNESNPDDRRRKQAPLLLTNKAVRDFDAQVKHLVQEKVHTHLTPKNPVVILSRAGCQAQAAHTDYVPDKYLATVKDDQMPLAVLVGLQNNTKLQVWPKSIRLIAQDSENLKKIHPIRKKEITFNKGDVVVFRGDFVHAGSQYDKENIRAHYYLDSDKVPRTQNRTYLIGRDGSRELPRILGTMR